MVELETVERLSSYPKGMSGQALINGNFDIWQRGTSVSLSDATFTYLADRWVDYHADDGGTIPTLTRSRETLTTGELDGSFYYTRLTTNGAGTSLGNNSVGQLGQSIEYGTRYLCGTNKSVTVSFWARSSIANKKIGIRAVQNYGTGGSPTSAEVINGTNWTLTSSWTKYTHTFTTNTLTGKTFGTANDDSFQIFLTYMWGSTRQSQYGASSAETYVGSGTIDIAQVQLCAGSVALPFSPKSFNDELRACQRYCQRINYSEIYDPIGIYCPGRSTTLIDIGIITPVRMRVKPTMTYSNISHFYLADTSGAITPTGVSDVANSRYNGYMYTTNLIVSGATQYRPYQFVFSSTNTAWLQLSADL